MSVGESQLSHHIPGIDEVPIIGILRRVPESASLKLFGIAQNSGIRAIEVTLDTDDAIGQIKRATESLDIAVGAGSVLSSDQAKQAVEAGAGFVVSPIVSSGVIETCLELGVPVIPGAATPTEIRTALDAGASAVKVFPIAQLGGPEYVRAIKSPLGEPPIIPTGGVTLSNARELLSAGALALGVGSALFPLHLLEEDHSKMGRHVDEWVRTMSR